MVEVGATEVVVVELVEVVEVVGAGMVAPVGLDGGELVEP